MPAVSAIGPGATPLTRMPSTPHSSASERVSESIAAFAADACACLEQTNGEMKDTGGEK
jgi:hypothetical protein